MAAVPLRVDALWPFSVGKAAGPVVPVHDAEMDLLKPASHTDPNPSKGESEIAVSTGALVPVALTSGTLSSSSFSNSTGDSISLYEVREGDSLSEIADMFGVSMNTILWANEIKDPGTIQPGDSLLILPVSGVAHEVKKGDTLASLAKKYKADANEIALFNGIDEDGELSIGTELIIPGGNLAPAPKKSSGSSSLGKAIKELTGYYANPVPGGRVTQGIHGYNGVDLGASCGTPVYASASGTIIVAKGGGGYNGGYGNYIAISHDNGTETLYAHLASLSVSGGAVALGDKIGTIGNTGRSTGCHLHFEVRGAKNPLAY